MRPIIHAAQPRIVYPITQADMLNGWTVTAGLLSLIREGGNVTLALSSASSGLNGSAATGPRFLAIPSWAAPALGNYGTLGWVSGNSSPVTLFKSQSFLACEHYGLVQGIVSWPTNAPMP